MPNDPHGTLRQRVLDAVLTSAGQTDPAVRHAAFHQTDLPGELRALLDKVEASAYRVTDHDIIRLKKAGYSDDQLFEIIVSGALGAAERRLLAGLEALDDA